MPRLRVLRFADNDIFDAAGWAVLATACAELPALRVVEAGLQADLAVDAGLPAARRLLACRDS